MTDRKILKDVTLSSQGVVQAVFCTFNVVDLDNDLVLPTAIKSGTPVVVSCWNHGSW